ncbi:hypothetical protein ACHAWF_010309 [Thalassiosira exigua]
MVTAVEEAAPAGEQPPAPADGGSSAERGAAAAPPPAAEEAPRPPGGGVSPAVKAAAAAGSAADDAEEAGKGAPPPPPPQARVPADGAAGGKRPGPGPGGPMPAHPPAGLGGGPPMGPPPPHLPGYPPHPGMQGMGPPPPPGLPPPGPPPPHMMYHYGPPPPHYLYGPPPPGYYPPPGPMPPPHQRGGGGGGAGGPPPPPPRMMGHPGPHPPVYPGQHQHGPPPPYGPPAAHHGGPPNGAVIHAPPPPPWHRPAGGGPHLIYQPGPPGGPPQGGPPGPAGAGGPPATQEEGSSPPSPRASPPAVTASLPSKDEAEEEEEGKKGAEKAEGEEEKGAATAEAKKGEENDEGEGEASPANQEGPIKEEPVEEGPSKEEPAEADVAKEEPDKGISVKAETPEGAPTVKPDKEKGAQDVHETSGREAATTPAEPKEPQPQGDDASPDPAGPSGMTKPKPLNSDGKEILDNATPTTCNETLSQISPSALDTSGETHPSRGSGSGAPPATGARYVYHTLQKPIRPGSSPIHSLGSFSRITGPPPSAYFTGGPPVSGGGGASGRRGPGGPVHPAPHPAYVYQYQHYDPREAHVPPGTERKQPHVGAPTPGGGGPPGPTPGGGGGGGGGGGPHDPPYVHGGYALVPPTVHMPGAPFLHVKDLSPLQPHFSAIKTGPPPARSGRGEGKEPRPPATPSRNATASPKESEAADAMAGMIDDEGGEADPGHREGRSDRDRGPGGPKSSPLDLLSSVSTSPVHPPGRPRPAGGRRGDRRGGSDEPSRAAGPPRGPTSYYEAPPPGGAAPPHAIHHPRHHRGPGGADPHLYYSYPPAPNYPPPTALRPHRSKSEDDDDDRRRRGETPPPGGTDHEAETPLTKSALPMDLILSAADTLDRDDDGDGRGGRRKRKLTDYSKAQVRKKLHRAPPSRPQNLFSVGGYPPGFDPSTLPPSRNSSKPGASSRGAKGRMLDDAVVTQAQKASMLAEQALERPRVGKQLLLSMALVRTNPRTPPSCYPAHGTILTDRFHWAAFPPLDNLLRRNMKQYYELSTNKCQSRDQQEFNNELVHRIKEEAARYGWEFDDKAFDDKKIRDRIRCFFKTHIQNAKKRLKTMLRNPEKRANIRALAAHFHLIEEKGIDHDGEYRSGDSIVDDEEDDGLGRSYSGGEGYAGYHQGYGEPDYRYGNDGGRGYAHDGQGYAHDHRPSSRGYGHDHRPSAGGYGEDRGRGYVHEQQHVGSRGYGGDHAQGGRGYGDDRRRADQGYVGGHGGGGAVPDSMMEV